MHICLLNLPKFELHRPPLILGLLSSICNSEQVPNNCIDLGIQLWYDLNDIYDEIDEYCMYSRISNSSLDRLKAYIERVVDQQIEDYPDTVFAISLISGWSQNVNNLVCEIIKNKYNNQILIGGPGIVTEDSYGNEHKDEYTNRLLSQGLIDHFIVGEGEIVFRRFLRGELKNTPGLNNHFPEQLDDFDKEYVIPDYTKVLREEYPYLYLSDGLELYLTASRGCVRNCGYCNVQHYWPKFKYREAKHIAEEMIIQYERHGARYFYFTDSLINGSTREIEKLCDYLIEYKEQHPEADFKWKGQFIFKPKHLMKESHIEKLARAGVEYIIVGLETGSDRVRYDMNKHHTTEDAEWWIQMLSKYKIKVNLLLLTGWVTESLEDHQDTLDLFPKWQRYVADGTIAAIEIGTTLSINEHSPIWKRIKELQIEFIDEKPYLWYSYKYPDLTIAERYRRWAEMFDEAIKYKWPITRGSFRARYLKNNFIEAVEFLNDNPMPKPNPLDAIRIEVLQ